MKFDASKGFGGILTLVAVVAVDARALPDFNTDDDLRAWHEYGLEKFHGPWALVAINSNGELINYTDYGSPIPANFRPISAIGEDDDLLEFLNERKTPPNENATIMDAADEYRKDSDESNNDSGKSTILELVGIIGVIERTENGETAT